MKQPPCYNCPDRQMKCHDRCERYKDYQDDRETIRTAKKQVYSIDGYFNDSITKSRKIKRLHG